MSYSQKDVWDQSCRIPRALQVEASEGTDTPREGVTDGDSSLKA